MAQLAFAQVLVCKLTLQNITKSFDARKALDDLSLTINRGEFFGLLGPNGAGKTTLINVAVGLLAADSGTVKIEGGELSQAARAKIGVAPQALALYEDFSAEANLQFFGRLYGLGGIRLRERIGQVLGFVGLEGRRRDKVDTFSGGMKRRLNIAVALVHDPELILLDEPTVGVDPQSRNAIFDAIRALHRQGKTILYTTHYMEEAERLCQRVAIIDHGKLLALDTVHGLVAHHGGTSTIIIESPQGEQRIQSERPLEELTRRVLPAEYTRVRIEQPGLEHVFLALTGRELRDE